MGITRTHSPFLEAQDRGALEPLAAAIWLSSTIAGFHRALGTEKISLYADDTLLYLGDANTSLTSAMEEIQHFGSLSGFSINWSKSALLPLDDPLVALPVGADSLKVVSSFKYLGVLVSANPLTYLEDNLLPLFKRF